MKMSMQLYQTLSQNTKSRDISSSDKKRIINIVPSLEEDEKEAFFLLIYEHYLITKNITNPIDTKNPFLPYGIIKEPSFIKFSLSKLPTKLRQILIKFVEVIEKNRLEK